MEQPDSSFANEFNVPQKDAVLVFNVRRAAVSLPFQVHHLKVLIEAGLVAFSCACSEFADEVPKEAQHGSLAHLPKVFPSHLHGLPKAAVVGFCVLAPPNLLSLLSCCAHLRFHIGPRAPTCSPRGRLERGTNSTAVESITSAMSVAMSLMQAPSGIGGSASTIAFAT